MSQAMLVKLVAGLGAAAILLVSRGEPAPGVAPAITASRSADSLPCHDILELSFEDDHDYRNKFFDVAVDATFTSPGGVEHPVKGFFYSGNTWKVRFRPDEPGSWSYRYTVRTTDGGQTQGDGSFACTPSAAEGPVHQDPSNPHRWVFANGEPYFPIGIQQCAGTSNPVRLFETLPIDGEQRDNPQAREVTIAEYFALYGQAGFNLFRFSPNNCSFPLYDNLDTYREDASLAIDRLLSLARNQGFRVMYGFFGYHKSPVMENDLLLRTPIGQDVLAKEKRVVDYSIARWGVYVDFWEFLNETKASDEWTRIMADYVHAADPERRTVSTSWEKPQLASIDVNGPHWYESESELASDLRIQQQAARWKQYGKPVVVGEQGNTGMNWDPLSALRMRIRTWTSLFEDIALVFWNTSWAKNGMNQGVPTPGAVSNIYLGPEERGYIRVLRDFADRLDAGVRSVPAEVAAPHPVRAYALRSDRVVAAYLHHADDHTTPVVGGRLTLELPGDPSQQPLVGEWIDPATGEVRARVTPAPGRQALEIPPFTVDLALLVHVADQRVESGARSAKPVQSGVARPR